jgi:hypothetical protein
MTQEFEVLMEESIKLLQPLPIHLVTLPDEYARVERAKKQGMLKLENRFIEIDDCGEFRSVLISAPKVVAVAMFFFPFPALQLPVFTMEFVVLAARPAVVVIDGQCLFQHMRCAGSVGRVFQNARELFADLSQTDNPPDGLATCRSSAGFFMRPRSLDDLSRLAQAHLFIWRGLIELLRSPAQFDEIGSHLHRLQLQNYKTHQRHYMPGLRLLNRSFGETWTRHYLSNYLFG